MVRVESGLVLMVLSRNACERRTALGAPCSPRNPYSREARWDYALKRKVCTDWAGGLDGVWRQRGGFFLAVTGYRIVFSSEVGRGG